MRFQWHDARGKWAHLQRLGMAPSAAAQSLSDSEILQKAVASSELGYMNFSY